MEGRTELTIDCSEILVASSSRNMMENQAEAVLFHSVRVQGHSRDPPNGLIMASLPLHPGLIHVDKFLREITV